MSALEELYSRAWLAVAQAALLGSQAAIFVGAFAAVLWRPAIVLVLAGFIGTLATHLALGVWGYRTTMRRPWPKVAPLVDDDWDY